MIPWRGCAYVIYSVPGSWIQDPGSRIQDPGSRILDPGSWILDPGSWILDPGSRMQAGSWILVRMSFNMSTQTCVCHLCVATFILVYAVYVYIYIILYKIMGQHGHGTQWDPGPNHPITQCMVVFCFIFFNFFTYYSQKCTLGVTFCPRRERCGCHEELLINKINYFTQKVIF